MKLIISLVVAATAVATAALWRGAAAALLTGAVVGLNYLMGVGLRRRARASERS